MFKMPDGCIDLTTSVNVIVISPVCEGFASFHEF